MTSRPIVQPFVLFQMKKCFSNKVLLTNCFAISTDHSQTKSFYLFYLWRKFAFEAIFLWRNSSFEKMTLKKAFCQLKGFYRFILVNVLMSVGTIQGIGKPWISKLTSLLSLYKVWNYALHLLGYNTVMCSIKKHGAKCMPSKTLGL